MDDGKAERYRRYAEECEQEASQAIGRRERLGQACPIQPQNGDEGGEKSSPRRAQPHRL